MEASHARHVLVAWFECEECGEGQLEAVVKLGDTAVPSLTATLRGGPSAERRATIERQLGDSHARLVEYARNHPEAQPTRSRDQFVERYSDAFVSLYRTRAARALGEIGSPAAIDSLRAVSPDSVALGRYVGRAIRQALAARR